MEPSSPNLTKVFISYSHKDVKQLKRLQVHLADLERNKLVDPWDDTKIVPGADWRQEIEQAIQSAKVAVLLISADFLASRFIAENELPPLLIAAEVTGTKILPVILSPCGFEYTKLSRFQAVNPPSTPISKMTNYQKEELWARLAGIIRNTIVQKIESPPSTDHRDTGDPKIQAINGVVSRPSPSAAETHISHIIAQAPDELLKNSSLNKQEDRSKLHRKFWEQLLKRAKERGVTTHTRRSPTDDNWLGSSFVKTGLSIEYQLYTHETGINLVIDTPDKNSNKRIFDQLFAQKEQIEADFGNVLDWKRSSNNRRSTIQFIMRQGGVISDETAWPMIQDEMISAMNTLSGVLARYLTQKVNGPYLFTPSKEAERATTPADTILPVALGDSQKLESVTPAHLTDSEVQVPQSVNAPLITNENTVIPATFNQVSLTDPETFTLLDTIEENSGAIYSSIAFSPDGQTLASISIADHQTAIKYWNIHKGGVGVRSHGHSSSGDSGFLKSFVITPDWQNLAEVSISRSFFDVDVSNLTRNGQLFRIRGFDTIRSVAISPDRKIVSSGSEDSTIGLWRTETGKKFHTLKGHSGPVNSVVISPGGHWLISGSEDCSIKLWNLYTGKLLNTFEGYAGVVYSLAIHPDGQTLISIDRSSTIRLWNIHTGELLYTLEDAKSYPGGLEEHGPTGADEAPTMKVWNIRTGELDYTLVQHSANKYSIATNHDVLRAGKLLPMLLEHSGAIKSFVIGSDWHILAKLDKDYSIKLWDLRTRELLHILKGQSGAINCIAISPDGNLLASGSEDCSIKLWNLPTGELLHTFKGHVGAIYSVAISPDGQWLASGSEDCSIKLWNLRTGALLHSLEWHTEAVYSITISPDGQTLASASGDQTIKIWGRELIEKV